jgi:hypothetical protein
MLPRIDHNGKYIDEFSSTLEDAASFEIYYNTNDRSNSNNPYSKKKKYETDKCRCSDPGCPCSGYKRSSF